MRQLAFALILIVLSLGTITARADVFSANPNLTITNYQVVNTQPEAAGLIEVTLQADLMNSGMPLGAVGALVATLDPYTVRVVPNQGLLVFTPVPANSLVRNPKATFSVLINPAVGLDLSKLQWTFTTLPAPPVANAGPSSSVQVGTTVVLDGSASTNPSGIGSLTYAWRFTSRPVGTKASKLTYEDLIQTSFIPDAVGIYAIQLTVTNGSMSSIATVYVTATP